MSKTHDIEFIKTLDRELISIIQDFLILGPLTWPVEAKALFLKGADDNNFTLPEMHYPQMDYSEKIARLKAYIKKTGTDTHPALTYLRNTAKSYLNAYYVLQGIGTTAVNEFSKKIYGGPKDIISGYERRNVDIAKYFLRISDYYKHTLEDSPLLYSDKDFAARLKKLLKSHIDPKKDPISITVDANMSARAAAGPNYVKIRKDARFSESDLNQLLHHEVLTHTLTYINGRKQPVLLSLGYAAPRTTATQEGLAVFSEYINLSIELVRLKRIALRIVALDMAEKGADLVDLFKFFKKNGQNTEESYLSSMRIFRGGTPKGGVIFYKDNVYLRGLIEVTGFLKKTMHSGNLHDLAILFAGKLTTQDVSDLQILIEDGYIEQPTYIPQWANNNSELAAHLAFNDLTERFKLAK
jgi:uncharacterized protein (TIGR02421 family)